MFPVDFDQFDHAARLVRAGVARRLRSLADLPGAVTMALWDDALAMRCRQFQATLAVTPVAEDVIADLVRARLDKVCPTGVHG